MKLACPALSLTLRGGDRQSESFVLQRLGCGDHRRRARSEGLERRHVRGPEPLPTFNAVENRQHAYVDAPRVQRNSDAACAIWVNLQEPGRGLGRDQLASARAQDPERDRALRRQLASTETGGDLPGHGDDPQRLVIKQHQHGRPRIDQGPATLDDELGDTIEISATNHLPVQRCRGLEAALGPLQLVLVVLARVVRPGVVDGYGGPFGQDDHRLLVGFVELDSALFLRQIEIAENLATNHHRDSEERLHRRMLGGEPVGTRMVADSRQPQRPRLADQFTEKAMPTRERADPPAKLVVNPDREEACEAGLLLVENAHRRVPARPSTRGLRSKPGPRPRRVHARRRALGLPRAIVRACLCPGRRLPSVLRP